MPGQTGRVRSRALRGVDVMVLQWRAGQLPGQTGWRLRLETRVAADASMEGRAIARPNHEPLQL